MKLNALILLAGCCVQCFCVEVLEVVLPHLIGLEEGVTACNGGVVKALLKRFQSLLSSPLNPGAVHLLAHEFSLHLDANGELRIPPSAWVASANTSSACVNETHRADDTRDKLCSVLYAEGQLEAQWIPNINPFEWRSQTILASTKLLHILKQILWVPENMPMEHRMASISNRVCRLVDLESESPVLKDSMHISCTLLDAVIAVTTCQTVISSSADSDCSKFSTASIIESFPQSKCFPHHSTLQHRSKLEAIDFADPEPEAALDLALWDLRPLPSRIPRTIRDAEVLTYLALFRASQMLYRFAQLDLRACIDSPEIRSLQVIPGWRVRLILAFNYPAEILAIERTEETELALRKFGALTVSTPTDSPCFFAVGLKGTSSRFEWVVDFRHWAIPFASFDNVTVHGGVARFVSVVAPPVLAFMQRESRTHQCTCEDTKLVTYGHSLGGGIASVLALHFSMLLNQRPELCRIHVDSVSFASLKVFTSEADALFRRNVNARHIIDVGDPLNYLPCSESNAKSPWLRCHKGLARGSGRDSWTQLPGLVEVNGDIERVVSGPRRNVNSTSRVSRRDSVVETASSLFRSGDIQNVSLLLGTPSSLTVLGTILQIVELFTATPGRLPTPLEIAAAHFSSLGCVLSKACRRHPWVPFRWWCDRIPEFVVKH